MKASRVGHYARQKRHAQRDVVAIPQTPGARTVTEIVQDAAQPAPKKQRTVDAETMEKARTVKKMRDAGALWKDCAKAVGVYVPGNDKIGNGKCRTLYRLANEGEKAPRKPTKAARREDPSAAPRERNVPWEVDGKGERDWKRVEIKKMLRGHRIEWINSISGLTESAEIGRTITVTDPKWKGVPFKTPDRIVTFTTIQHVTEGPLTSRGPGPGPTRTVRLSAISQVY